MNNEKQIARATELRDFDNKYRNFEGCVLAGVDEVGRGCLAGPVVTACVVLPKDFEGLGIDDSKKLSEKKRAKLYDTIMESATAVGIGRIEAPEVDKINILNATKKAMRIAIAECVAKMKASNSQIDKILIDAVDLGEIKNSKGEKIKIESIIKGDSKSMSIAAASIVAKVTRDRFMIKMAEVYPDYAFESNKGYGTKAHYAGIEKEGICPLHRKTYLKNIHLV